MHAGTPSTEARRLCETTERALHEAIKLCGPGVPYNMIGKVSVGIYFAISFVLVEESGCFCMFLKLSLCALNRCI